MQTVDRRQIACMFQFSSNLIIFKAINVLQTGKLLQVVAIFLIPVGFLWQRFPELTIYFVIYIYEYSSS